MAVPVVIQSVQLQTDGFVHATGTVNGGAPLSIQPIPLAELVGLSVAQIQLSIALQLCLVAGVQLTFASLNTTITF